MVIKAVISDFGGVLVRTRDSSGRRTWEERFNLRAGDLSRLVFESEVARAATIGKADEREVWNHVKKTLGLNEQQIRDLELDFWSGDFLDTQLLDFMKSLKPDYHTAILSNAWNNGRDLFTGKFHLDEVFNPLIISAEIGLRKPFPEIFSYAVNLMGLKPENAIFIDDDLENVLGAKCMGIQAVQFVSTDQVVRDTKRLID